jgi:hypothetical protein
MIFSSIFLFNTQCEQLKKEYPLEDLLSVPIGYLMFANTETNYIFKGVSEIFVMQEKIKKEIGENLRDPNGVYISTEIVSAYNKKHITSETFTQNKRECLFKTKVLESCQQYRRALIKNPITVICVGKEGIVEDSSDELFSPNNVFNEILAHRFETYSGQQLFFFKDQFQRFHDDHYGIDQTLPIDAKDALALLETIPLFKDLNQFLGGSFGCIKILKLYQDLEDYKDDGNVEKELKKTYGSELTRRHILPSLRVLLKNYPFQHQLN